MANENGKGVVAAISALLGLVGTALGVYASWQGNVLKAESDRQKAQIDRQDAQIRLNQEERARLTGQREYFLKVIDKILEAVEQENAKKQEIALALVDSLDDPHTRERLARLFQAAPTATNQTKERAGAIRESAQFTIAQQTDRGWDYDVFWCEGNAANEAVGRQIGDAILKDPNHGRVRVRPLSAQQNQRSGYGATGVEIRAERNEQEQADRLLSMIKPVAGDAIIRTSSLDTPWYLSVFVCR
jgi:hypothetical protein